MARISVCLHCQYHCATSRNEVLRQISTVAYYYKRTDIKPSWVVRTLCQSILCSSVPFESETYCHRNYHTTTTTLTKQEVIENYRSTIAQQNLEVQTNLNNSSISTRVYTSLLGKSSSLVDYSRGWAWQNLLLQRRLDYKRRRQQRHHQQQQQQSGEVDITTSDSSLKYNDDNTPMNDENAILILEHNHTYTLGRGSDENYLTFLSQHDNYTNNKLDDKDYEQILYKLSRKNRGRGTARLCFGNQKYVSATDCDDTIESFVNQLCPPDNNNNNNSSRLDDCCMDIKTSLINVNNNIGGNNALGICPVIAPNGVPIFRVERGGEVTYHGPGQLVVYPLIDLQEHQQQENKKNPDLHEYLRTIEQIIIDTLQTEYNIIGYRDDINTGVWVTQIHNEKQDDDMTGEAIEIRNKIAAVGVACSRWITTHGFALNVCPDLKYFDTSIIIPCGIPNTDDDDDRQQEKDNYTTDKNQNEDNPHRAKKKKIQRGVTSIADILRNRGDSHLIPTTEQVSHVILQNIQSKFELDIVYSDKVIR